MVAPLALTVSQFHPGFEREAVEPEHLVPDFFGPVFLTRTPEGIDQQALELPMAIVVADEFLKHRGGLLVILQSLPDPVEQHHALDVARGEAAEALQRLERLIEHLVELAATSSGQTDKNTRVGPEHIHVVRRETVGDGRVFRRLVEAAQLLGQELRQTDPEEGSVRSRGHGPFEEIEGLVYAVRFSSQQPRRGEQERSALGGCRGGLLRPSLLRSEANQGHQGYRHGSPQRAARKGPETCFPMVHGAPKGNTLPRPLRPPRLFTGTAARVRINGPRRAVADRFGRRIQGGGAR